VFRNASARADVPMWKRLLLEEEIVTYLSVSLSSALCRNKKV